MTCDTHDRMALLRCGWGTYLELYYIRANWMPGGICNAGVTEEKMPCSQGMEGSQEGKALELICNLRFIFASRRLEQIGLLPCSETIPDIRFLGFQNQPFDWPGGLITLRIEAKRAPTKSKAFFYIKKKTKFNYSRPGRPSLMTCPDG